MKSRNIDRILEPDFLMLGGKTIAQTLPSSDVDQHDPFLLLHHAGPYDLKAENAHFYVGPHPHRGFEPITFVFQGGVRHKDSLGNDSSIEAPGSQWITAGRGIIHSEQSSAKFEELGGTFELIQLWVNLPAKLKMSPAKYQTANEAELINISDTPEKNKVYLVSGEANHEKGKIISPTGIKSLMAYLKAGSKEIISLSENSSAIIYLLGGELDIQGQQVKDKQLAILQNEGTSLEITVNADSRVLILEGQALKEETVSWGPYVMNSQREIMEAMRDYNQGKMGFLAS